MERPDLKLICAPMATLSHEAFRICIEQFGGCNEYFTEMINAPSLTNMGPFEKYYLLNGPVPEKIVWQLTGNSVEHLAKATSIVAAKGGIGIDINMGCSAPQIYKTGAGIAWMLKPIEETRTAVHEVKEALSDFPNMRLSVKCRLGDDDFTDKGFFNFTDMLVEEGVELITLHARTKKEKFRGHPRYEYVERLKERYGDEIKVYLNGDIKDWNTANNALVLAPRTDGLMIARTAAQKPWIFASLRKAMDGNKEKDTVDCQQLALDFIDNVETYQPPEFHKTRLQRFFAYYCDNFSFAHYFKTNMLNAHSIEESREQVADYFLKEPDDRYKEY